MWGLEGAGGTSADGVHLGGNFIFAGEREVPMMWGDVWRDIQVGERQVRRGCPSGIAGLKEFCPKPQCYTGAGVSNWALLTCEALTCRYRRGNSFAKMVLQRVTIWCYHVVSGKASVLLGHVMGEEFGRTYSLILSLCSHRCGLHWDMTCSFSFSAAKGRWVSCWACRRKQCSGTWDMFLRECWKIGIVWTNEYTMRASTTYASVAGSSVLQVHGRQEKKGG